VRVLLWLFVSSARRVSVSSALEPFLLYRLLSRAIDNSASLPLLQRPLPPPSQSKLTPYSEPTIRAPIFSLTSLFLIEIPTLHASTRQCKSKSFHTPLRPLQFFIRPPRLVCVAAPSFSLGSLGLKWTDHSFLLPLSIDCTPCPIWTALAIQSSIILVIFWARPIPFTSQHTVLPPSSNTFSIFNLTQLPILRLWLLAFCAATA
jgi:hypothetical protein